MASERYGSFSACAFRQELSCAPVRLSVSQRTMLIGPAIVGGDDLIAFRAHALAGRDQENSNQHPGTGTETDHSFGYLLGVGFDFRVHRRIAVRVEGNEFHTNYGLRTSQNYLLATTGLVARF